ncbi:hypothetical protein WR25_02801 [Diploscapter pachys]|uniref:Uncharacterized protein n=1 Tax=Diploscapter pachys TaxID=2018661 RepID=A0A2A2LY62_9BILA|nr:hypothetical protein WR25_02801 [Diploscapter pachys]
MGREGTSSARRRESLCALSTKLLLAGKCKSIDDFSWSVERGMQQNGMTMGKDRKVLILAVQESIWCDVANLLPSEKGLSQFKTVDRVNFAAKVGEKNPLGGWGHDEARRAVIGSICARCDAMIRSVPVQARPTTTTPFEDRPLALCGRSLEKGCSSRLDEEIMRGQQLEECEQIQQIQLSQVRGSAILQSDLKEMGRKIEIDKFSEAISVFFLVIRGTFSEQSTE